jgi:hypothetical protein
MLPFMTVAVVRSNQNLWINSLYAGAFTAVVALILVLVTGIAVLPALVGLLIGAAPILAYQFSNGTLGADWKPIIAGIIGYILFIAALFMPAAAVGWLIPVLGLLSMLIWPLVVGAMMPSQSIGRLFLGSLLGLLLGIVIAFVVALALGQDPYAWTGLAGVLFFSFWGGTVGAAMTAWAQ